MEKTCIECGETFYCDDKHSWQKFCKPKCRGRHNNQKRDTRELNRRCKEQGICVSCHKANVDTNTVYCSRCRELNSQRAKERQIKKKKLVLSKYGEKCECCGDNTYEFLTIDHINNDGPNIEEKLVEGNCING